MKMHELPDGQGHSGRYGGVFVAETLVHALDELKRAYEACRKDPEFVAEFEYELKHYVGRPSPVYHARRWSEKLGGAQLYFKREDLNHTGAHKINNCIGQALLARAPLPRPSPRASACNASSTWDPRTSGVRRRTCFA